MPSFDAAVEPLLPAPSRSSHFVVRGWCFERTGLPVRGIRLRCGGRTFQGTYGHDRLNLLATLARRPLGSRLSFEVPVALAEAARAELEAQVSDDRWYPVLTLDLPRSTRQARDWRAFWRQAWRGEPEAWNDLSEAERDYAAAVVRVRGWLNLSTEPQRPPQPVALESFPSDGPATSLLPRLTVVTPSWQQAAFLEQAITSVLDQQGALIDYIVEDGGSTDGSLEIIGRYASRLASFRSGPDGGQSDAIAKGFATSTGQATDLMMFLNADDIMLPGVARFVSEYFLTHPDVDVLYGHRVLLDEDGLEVGRWFTPRPRCLGLALHDLIPQETIFWRRRIWDRVRGIDRTMRFALDWDLLLRFEAAGARLARVPWFLGGFRLHPGQKTQTRWTDVALPEIQALRRRTLGRTPTADELHLAMRRAQVDSALVCASFQRGRRL
jgi:hypothetical protein